MGNRGEDEGACFTSTTACTTRSNAIPLSHPLALDAEWRSFVTQSCHLLIVDASKACLSPGSGFSVRDVDSSD